MEECVKDMKKLIKGTITLLALASAAGLLVGYSDHKKNKKEGRKPRTIYEDGIKRGLDFTSGMAAIIVFWPLYLIVAILVRTKLGSPILFTQERPGRDGRIFKLYKFRTMTDEKDEAGNLLPDEIRLTKFGKILRSTSLDELPEAINIVKGDMSVIGPRPLLVQYLDRYNEHQKHRHDVRPGLSGYAQTNGRNTVTWKEKFDLDVWYTEHVSFKLDVKIIKDTVVQAFFKREGISSETSVTMEEFMGDEE